VVAIVLANHALPPRLFRPYFLEDLVAFTLGSPSNLTVGLWLSVAALGLWTSRHQRWLWWLTAGVAAIVLTLWIFVQPPFLYPRFFIFLVPVSAYLMAVAIKRWWVLAPVVLTGAALAVISQLPNYTTDPLALRQAAQSIDQVHRGGGRACVLHGDDKVLVAYSKSFVTISTAQELSLCEVIVIATWDVDASLRRQAIAEFPVHDVLPAVYPTLVLMRSQRDR
jgi:hypothetical protein